jgi:hypothetical protein
MAEKESVCYQLIMGKRGDGLAISWCSGHIAAVSPSCGMQDTVECPFAWDISAFANMGRWIDDKPGVRPMEVGT